MVVMEPNGWVAVGVASLAMLALALQVATPDLVMMAALAALLVAGVLDPEQALAGFSTPALGSVAALLVVAAGVGATGGLDVAGRRLLGHPRNVGAAQLRVMLPTAGMSAFLNNTPVVALLVPVVLDWSRRTGVAASKLLLPLSYASILGGFCTLIGTSTNLVVVGMASRRFPEISFGLFDVAVFGLPAVFAGTGYVLLASRWLLPDRSRPTESLENPREYTVAMTVAPGSPVADQTIEEAGLRSLPGLFVLEVERGPDVLAAPGPTTRLRAGDVVVFVGVVAGVRDLRRIPGLEPATDQVRKLVSPTRRRRLFEAVVAAGSPMVGKTVRDFGFRTRYDAVIIAVHRRGGRVHGKVGDIVLRPGDALLVEGSAEFGRRRRNDRDFALVAEVEGSQPVLHEKAPLSLGILALMVAMNATGLVPLFVAALVAAGLMVATRCLTGTEARRSLDLQVLLTIGAAFGVGRALEVSGAATALGGGVVALGGGLGAVGVLAATYLATAVLTELVTNNAAAALMFPIAASAAEVAGVDLHTTALVVMVAASASFTTPIGYQTNLMVLGPGGYRFGDFVRFGLPLQLVVAASTLCVAALLLGV